MKILSKIAVIVGICAAVYSAGYVKAETITNNGNFTQTIENKYINVSTIGSGKDVILIPGLGCSPEVYQDIIDNNSSNYKFHLVKIAGFNNKQNIETDKFFNSIAIEINNYIEKNHLKNVSIIGHSFGGALGIKIASLNNPNIDKLMTIDALSFYSLIMNPNATVENSTASAEIIAKTIQSQTDAEFKSNQNKSVNRLVKNNDVKQKIIDWTLNSNKDVMAEAIKELIVTDLRPDLSKIKAKTTILYAYDTSMGIPSEIIDGLYKNAYQNLEQKTLIRIDNSYHFIMYDQQKEFANKVAEFLK